MKWSANPAILRDPVHFLAFGCGAGLSPFAPGTAGTLVAVPLLLLIQHLSFETRIMVIAAITLIGIYICGASSRKLGVHDHSGIVFDEIAGFLIAGCAIPPGWQWVISAFVLFRFFDIVKPSPIREADHSLRGGLGIMLDDVIAGLFSAVLLYAVPLLIRHLS